MRPVGRLSYTRLLTEAAFPFRLPVSEIVKELV